MRFRIYDIKSNKYVSSMWTHPSGLIANERKQLLKRSAIDIVNEDDYEIEMCTDCVDVNKVPIYEGDIIKCNNRIGLIKYISEKCAFVFLDYMNNKWYQLSENICRGSQIIGNIHTNEDLLEYKDGEEKKETKP